MTSRHALTTRRLNISTAVVAVLLVVSISAPMAFGQEGESNGLTDNVQMISLAGVLLGTGMRTALPFLQAKKAGTEDKPISFDSKYAATFGFATIISIMTALMGFGSFVAPSGETMLGILIVAIVYGWGLNSIVNKFAGG